MFYCRSMVIYVIRKIGDLNCIIIRIWLFYFLCFCVVGECRRTSQCSSSKIVNQRMSSAIQNKFRLLLEFSEHRYQIRFQKTDIICFLKQIPYKIKTDTYITKQIHTSQNRYCNPLHEGKQQTMFQLRTSAN